MALQMLLPAGNIQGWLQEALAKYRAQHHGDTRVLLAGLVLGAVLFFMFLLQPLLFLARGGAFVFVAYSCWYVVGDSELGRNDASRGFAYTLYVLLFVYLVKMLL